MPMKHVKITNPVDNTLQFLSIGKEELSVEKDDKEFNLKQKKPMRIQDRPKTDKTGGELKRKRYNLLLYPSIYKDIEKIAYVKNISINEAVNQAIKLYRDMGKNELEKYTEIEKLKASNNAVKTTEN